MANVRKMINFAKYITLDTWTPQQDLTYSSIQYILKYIFGKSLLAQKITFCVKSASSNPQIPISQQAKLESST